MIRYLIIAVVLITVFTANGCSSPKPTNTPPPLPTARPIVDYTSSNANAIANALPAKFEAYPLSAEPRITNNSSRYEIYAPYTLSGLLGTNGAEITIWIHSTVNGAINQYNNVRSSPEWETYATKWDEGLLNDGFGFIRYTNVIIYVEAYSGIEESEISSMLYNLIRIIESPNLTVAQQPLVMPTNTPASAPFGSTQNAPDATATQASGSGVVSSDSSSSLNPVSGLLGLLRDQAWAGIAVIITVVLWFIDRARKR